MKRLKEKLKCIYHIITDREYVVFTGTSKNKKASSYCAIISDNATEQFIEAIIKTLDNAFTHENHWRKVSEELPNNRRPILVKTIDNTYHTAVYYANRGYFYSISMYELDDYKVFLIDGIVEWKPIN